MDFKQLLGSGQSALPIEPRELFEQLPNKQPGYGYLRDVQAQVLTKWHEHRDQRDSVIKVNTGGGKTIDGLIILQSYLNEGLGPALYVAPGKYLEEQAIAEAAKLGINVVTNPDDPKYLSSEAIAVINAHKLFNGQTVFSDKRESRPMAPIGVVVVDDAHAALATLNETLSLNLPSSTVAHTQIIDLFENELHQQSADTLADIRDNSHEGALLRVPFWAVRTKVDRLRTILRTEIAWDHPLYWSWPAVREVLSFSRVVVTPAAITITPPCPPIGHATAFATAKRRVFLSATLADDSVLVTDFGADPDNVTHPITPLTAGDIGERMILAPQEINPSLAADEVRSAIVELSKIYNTVVIVPGNAGVARWRAEADRIPTTNDDINATVMALKSGLHVGLVVLNNRYDGIDLPQDACRILVLDGLPGAFSGEDRLESLLTSREAGVDDRQVQRIEQGMGRAVRSNEDHCVIFLIGSKLAQLTVDPRTLPRFSPATQAQLQLSRTMAASMKANESLTEIIKTATQALTRDSDWVKFAKLKLSGIAPPPGTVAPHAAPRRNAYDAAASGDFTRAASILETAVDAQIDSKQRGWLREQHAVYLEQVDPVQAQDVLRLAHSENYNVTRPLSPLTFRPIDAEGTQADRCVSKLTTMFGSGSSALLLGFEAILDDLDFDPARTDEFEAAFHQLGYILGLGSQRPELELAKGPDNLWALGGGRYWVIEAKSGATSAKIGKRDAAQLAASKLWFDQSYSDTCSATPVLIHPADTLYPDASAPEGTQVLTDKGMKMLVDNVRAFGKSLAPVNRSDSTAVGPLLTGHRLTVRDLATYLRPLKG
ncbi:DEAD/DEAH box helicase family protein [Nocardia salmonicida]|uniref:DEAD/DEAH box helicase family protein n=1 Tax=Nocardia salmonicida TaxID=53431 RepID=UPI0037ADED66